MYVQQLSCSGVCSTKPSLPPASKIYIRTRAGRVLYWPVARLIKRSTSSGRQLVRVDVRLLALEMPLFPPIPPLPTDTHTTRTHIHPRQSNLAPTVVSGMAHGQGNGNRGAAPVLPSEFDTLLSTDGCVGANLCVRACERERM